MNKFLLGGFMICTLSSMNTSCMLLRHISRPCNRIPQRHCFNKVTIYRPLLSQHIDEQKRFCDRLKAEQAISCFIKEKLARREELVQELIARNKENMELLENNTLEGAIKIHKLRDMFSDIRFVDMQITDELIRSDDESSEGEFFW